jgi:hypothetical protein
MTYIDQLPSSMRPTPGPWTCDGRTIMYATPHESGELTMIEVNANIAEDGWDTVAFIEAIWPGAYANARLIAAAPDLLEAIPPLIALVHRLLPRHAQSDSTLDNLPEVIQARAALAKSTPINPSTYERTLPMTHKLPPDPENKNDDRAAWAGKAMAAFIEATGADEEDCLGDLLADLMHWCDRNNYAFDLALDRARGHYEAETIGE